MIVLGHSGFAGSALVEGMTRQLGSRVIGYSSADIDLSHGRSAARLEDLVSRDAVLIITAGYQEGPDTVENFERNIAILTTLADFLSRNPVRKCVYFSTASVYGDLKTNLGIHEDTPLQPTSYYGISKVAGEALLRRATESAGTPLVILRPCRMYGPGDRKATYGPSRFVKSILENGKIEMYGGGEELRDHIYIDDVVRVASSLAMGPVVGTFNLASGESHSYKQMVEILRNACRNSFAIASVPRTRPFIDQGFDVSRLRKALPDLKLTSLEDGMHQTFDAFEMAFVKGLSK